MATPPTPNLSVILSAVQRLSPADRRQLHRRLQASGLFVPDTLQTDQRRLEIAPALGVKGRPARKVSRPPKPKEPAVPAAQPQPDTNGDDTYRSPVSGKFVVGSPDQAPASDPHAMHPLPGQAPEQPITLIFDGGSKGNPGKGYGSYAMRWPGRSEQIVRLQFGDNVTNNQAEYDTLIAALEAILERLDENGADPATARIAVYGDSLLVINQILERWKCNESQLLLRRDKAQQLLDNFGLWRLVHQSRDKSVAVLGH